MNKFTISNNFWNLYLDFKKNRGPISVSFDEKDNLVSLAVERQLIKVLVAKNVLNGSTYLLNHDYKNMSDEELHRKLNEVLYTDTGKLPSSRTENEHLTYGECDQARNLVKFLRISNGNRLSIRTKLEVRYDTTLSKIADNSRYNAWISSVKEEPKLKESHDVLVYYIKLDNYYGGGGRRGFLVFKDGHPVTV